MAFSGLDWPPVASSNLKGELGFKGIMKLNDWMFVTNETFGGDFKHCGNGYTASL